MQIPVIISYFVLLGVEFPFIPETNGVPLVADMSSNMFSRPFDHTKVIEHFMLVNLIGYI